MVKETLNFDPKLFQSFNRENVVNMGRQLEKGDGMRNKGQSTQHTKYEQMQKQARQVSNGTLRTPSKSLKLTL